MNNKIIAASLLTVITTFSLSAIHAEEQRKGPPGGGKPSTEAFAACASLSENQSCSYTGNRGDATGTCKGPRQGEGALACVPAGRPPSK